MRDDEFNQQQLEQQEKEEGWRERFDDKTGFYASVHSDEEYIYLGIGSWDSSCCYYLTKAQALRLAQHLIWKAEAV